MAERVRARASIRDVARHAGVSNQTVSRVINGSAEVREETKQRVLRAMEELKYRPNTAARTLVTSRSNVIGVLACNSAMYGPASSIAAVEAAARERGQWVSIATFDPEDEATLRLSLAHLVAQSVEAIVVITPTERVRHALTEEEVGVPYVSLQTADLRGEHAVSVDQTAGARLATRHLIELGHRRIAHLAGPDDWMEAKARLGGYVDEMRAHGLEIAPPIAGDWTADSGYRAGLELLRSPHFTAVFAANDQMAFGLMHALHEAGVRVPDDVSVIGFDDMPESAHVLPPLTTLRQDFGDLGRRCVGLLLSTLAGGKMSGRGR